MLKHNEDWDAVFKEYNLTRKQDGDALQDLSLDNYFEMRDYVADEQFLLRKKRFVCFRVSTADFFNALIRT